MNQPTQMSSAPVGQPTATYDELATRYKAARDHIASGHFSEESVWDLYDIEDQIIDSPEVTEQMIGLKVEVFLNQQKVAVGSRSDSVLWDRMAGVVRNAVTAEALMVGPACSASTCASAGLLMSDWWSFEEEASRCGISPRTLRNLIKRLDAPVLRSGRVVRFDAHCHAILTEKMLCQPQSATPDPGSKSPRAKARSRSTSAAQSPESVYLKALKLATQGSPKKRAPPAKRSSTVVPFTGSAPR
jgi:hypothetical protein